MDADNPQPPTTKDLSNLSQLAAAAELQRLKTAAMLDVNEVSDAEIDQALRAAGGDPEAIGRRGLEAALAELKKLRPR